MRNAVDYVPESPEEELFELVGRVNALAAYVNKTKYSIERELIAAMLGFELKEDSESAKDNCSDGNSKLD